MQTEDSSSESSPEQSLSHPVDEDDSTRAGAGGEVLLTAVEQRHYMLNVFVHTALLTQVQLVQTLLLPLAERFVHSSCFHVTTGVKARECTDIRGKTLKRIVIPCFTPQVLARC